MTHKFSDRSSAKNLVVFFLKRKLFFALAMTVIFCSLTLIISYFYHQPKPRSLLIIGCARSGTSYIAEVLQQKGLRIGHEKMRPDGTCSWPLAVFPKEGRWGLRPANYHFAHVFHQVRDPLMVISSVYVTEDNDSWHYIMKHLPQIHVSDPHLVKCAKYWYYWNLQAEKHSEWTYQIEKLDSKWEEFEQRLGKHLAPLQASLPKNINSRQTEGRKYFTWEDLKKELDPELYQNIQQLARKYGYTVDHLSDEHSSLERTYMLSPIS